MSDGFLYINCSRCVRWIFLQLLFLLCPIDFSKTTLFAVSDGCFYNYSFCCDRWIRPTVLQWSGFDVYILLPTYLVSDELSESFISVVLQLPFCLGSKHYTNNLLVVSNGSMDVLNSISLHNHDYY